MATHVSTPTLVLANAFNNWSGKPEKHVAFARATIEEGGFDMLKKHGYTVVAIEDVSAKDLWNALYEYRGKTDWSAFSLADWEAAFDSIN